MTCPFYNSIIDVPAEYLQEVQEAAEAKQVNKWTKWIIIGAILLFVVPAYIGFSGTILGIMAAIFSSIIGILVAFVGK